jgi:hypothetical protein
MSEHQGRRERLSVDVHHHIEGLDVVRNLIDHVRQVLSQLHEVKQEIRNMSGALSQKIADLQSDVQADTSVTESAVTLINGFAQRLQEAIDAAKASGATDAELQALSDLHAATAANTQRLADAVAANTPPSQEPAPQPDPGTQPQP